MLFLKKNRDQGAERLHASSDSCREKLYLHSVACGKYLPSVNATVVKVNKNWARSTKSVATNGPFKLAAWDNHKVVLTKNPNYYAANEIQFSEVQFLLPVAGQPSNTAAYLDNKLDWIGGGETTAIDYRLLTKKDLTSIVMKEVKSQV